MPEPQHKFTREEVDAHFAALGRALAAEPWDVERLGRKPHADEFMLMAVVPQGPQGAIRVGQFKHHNTRNYVFLAYRGATVAPKLIVPRTSEPFMRGEF